MDSPAPSGQGLRAVFVNYAHPDLGHVSAMRGRYFAEAIARRGHQVVLLTPRLEEGGSDADLKNLQAELVAHNWAEPFRIAIGSPAVRRQSRVGRLAPALRRLETARSLLFGNGAQEDWVRSSRGRAKIIARAFRPQLVWTTFGSVSGLVLAQRIAHLAECPWVIDVKDSWSAFVPAGLRGPVARRFRDAAGLTANARHHLAIAQRWHRQDGVVAYSGVAPEMMAQPARLAAEKKFRLTLVGSLYDEVLLSRFLAGLERWSAALPAADRENIEFCYAGGASSAVEAALRGRALGIEARVLGPLPLHELGMLCQSSAVNCYLWASFGFHHKLLELIACARPVLSFPGEHDESVELARACGGELHSPTSEAALVAALEALWRKWRAGGGPGPEQGADKLSWDAMSEGLETSLLEIVARAGVPR